MPLAQKLLLIFILQWWAIHNSLLHQMTTGKAFLDILMVIIIYKIFHIQRIKHPSVSAFLLSSSYPHFTDEWRVIKTECNAFPMIEQIREQTAIGQKKFLPPCLTLGLWQKAILKSEKDKAQEQSPPSSSVRDSEKAAFQIIALGNWSYAKVLQQSMSCKDLLLPDFSNVKTIRGSW